MNTAPTILIISQASSLPGRRRTWQQAQALAVRGWSVQVICPCRPGQRRFEIVEGIAIRRFPQPFEGAGAGGLLLEYLIAAIAILILAMERRLAGRINIVQVVNPPDWLILPAMLLGAMGARIVFDLADLSSLLAEVKFGRASLLTKAISRLERCALAAADLVITANEPYRRLAVRLGRRRARLTLAVPSFPLIPPIAAARAPGRVRVGYFGIVGQHDGVETLITAFALLLRSPGLPPVELVIVGDGPALPNLRSLARRLAIENHVRFLGYLEGNVRETEIAAFDIAVIPERITRYSRSISMNKAFAYAAHGCAIVSTPLAQTRRLLGDAASYSDNDTSVSLARALAALIADGQQRRHLGEAARDLAKRDFNWADAADRYVVAITGLLDGSATSVRIPAQSIA